MWKEILLLVLIYNVVAEVMAKKHHEGSTAAKKKQPHHMQDANEHDEVDNMVKKWKKISLKKKRNQNAQRRAAVVAKGAAVREEEELANNAKERANRLKLIPILFRLIWKLNGKGTEDTGSIANEQPIFRIICGEKFQELKTAVKEAGHSIMENIRNLDETKIKSLITILEHIHQQTENSQDRPDESSDLPEEESPPTSTTTGSSGGLQSENPSAEGSFGQPDGPRRPSGSETLKNTIIEKLKNSQMLDKLKSKLKTNGKFPTLLTALNRGFSGSLIINAMPEESLNDINDILTAQSESDEEKENSSKKSSEEGLNDKFMDEKAMKEWAAKHEKE